MPNVIERICTDLTVPERLIVDAIRLAHVRYRKIRVPKRTGGYRKILQPAAELKLIQKWLDTHILSPLPVSTIALAFCQGSSIVRNANIHRQFKYSVRVDLADFFPSLKYDDLKRVLYANADKLPPWASDSDVGTLVATACFDKSLRLPIGYCTSPRISNALMYDFDQELVQIISKDVHRFGNAVVTRYADDFVFSTEKRGACREFVGALRKLAASTMSPSLRVNEDKTRFMSRPAGSTLVTGLRITQAGIVRVHPTYRDHVRLLLKLYARGSLQAEEVQKLRGHLAFVEHSDPSLFTRLSFKYYEAIGRIRRG